MDFVIEYYYFWKIDAMSIFTELSKKLGCDEKFTENQSSEEWIQSIYNKFYMQSKSQGLNVADLETLKEKNFERMLMDLDEEDYVPFKAFRDDPLKNPLGTPSGKIEIYSEKISFPSHVRKVFWATI